jgi:hypothetical protein
VRTNAVSYFENYVYPLIGFSEKGYTVEGMATQEQLFNFVAEEEINPYCLGIYFKTFDLENHDFEIEYSLRKFITPETTAPAHNELVLVADWDSWYSWTNSGILMIEAFIAEFIARSYKDKATPDATVFSDTVSLYDQQLGFAALKSVEYV